MPTANAKIDLDMPGEGQPQAVSVDAVSGALERPSAGIVDRPGPRSASRMEWLRGMLRVELGPQAVAALDGVRGLAATLVFVVHFQAAFGPLLGGGAATAIADYAALVGYHGVNVFFVLSGFLIYGSLIGRPTPLRTYLWRRLRRIYPTFLAVLLLYLTVGRLIPGRVRLPSTDIAAYLVKNALLLPGVFPVTPIITVAWSLSYEIFFYLGIAAIVLGLRLRGWPARYRVALFAGILVAWAVAGAQVQRAVGSFVMFLPGILTWELSRTRWAESARAHIASSVVWAVLVATLLLVPAMDRLPVARMVRGFGVTPAALTVATLGAAVPLLLVHALGRTGSVSRRLGWPPLRLVGLISYSFYLIHGATINVIALAFWRFAGPTPPNGMLLYAALIPVVYTAAVLAGLVLFRTVEQRLSL